MRIPPSRRAEPPAAIKVIVLLSGAHSTIRRWTDNIYLWRAPEGREEEEEEEEEAEEEEEEEAQRRRLRSRRRPSEED